MNGNSATRGICGAAPVRSGDPPDGGLGSGLAGEEVYEKEHENMRFTAVEKWGLMRRTVEDLANKVGFLCLRGVLRPPLRYLRKCLIGDRLFSVFFYSRKTGGKHRWCRPISHIVN
jgi:hypothetical protein